MGFSAATVAIAGTGVAGGDGGSPVGLVWIGGMGAMGDPRPETGDTVGVGVGVTVEVDEGIDDETGRG